MLLDGNSAAKLNSEWDNIELARILASRTFGKTEQLKSILSYICGAAAAGRVPTEAEIGRNTLNRPDFDPSADTLVRVHMRRLRQKLEEYYQTEGSSDQFRIDIPKQSYAPIITRVVDASPPAQPAEEPVSPFRSWQVRAALIAACILFGVAGWAIANVGPRHAPGPAATPHALPADLRAVWGAFIDERQEPLLAISAPLFFKTKSYYIRDYRMNFLNDLPNQSKLIPSPIAWPVWATWISYSDAECAVMMTGFLGSFGKTVTLQAARRIQNADFTHPVIFLGHPRGSPILRELLERRNFYAERSDATGVFIGIGNRAPRPGEPALYRGSGADEIQDVSELYPDYGLITMIKTRSSPPMLSVFGHRPLSTTPLLKWLLDPDLDKRLASIGIRQPFSEIQIVFKLIFVDNVPVEAVPVAARMKP